MLVLEGGSLLAATDAGGVWLVYGGSPDLCLTNSLTAAQFASLAADNYDPQHQIYARGDGLYVTNLASPLPLFNWLTIQLPVEAKFVFRVLVLSDRIVLACAGGMFWSPIPPKSSTAYTFNPAEVRGGAGTIVRGGFYDVAPGVRRVTRTSRGTVIAQEIIAGGRGGQVAGLFGATGTTAEL